MQKDQQKLAELIRGKKVAFIGANFSDYLIANTALTAEI